LFFKVRPNYKADKVRRLTQPVELKLIIILVDPNSIKLTFAIVRYWLSKPNLDSIQLDVIYKLTNVRILTGNQWIRHVAPTIAKSKGAGHGSQRFLVIEAEIIKMRAGCT